jgi:hypothetical protein
MSVFFVGDEDGNFAINFFGETGISQSLKIGAVA